MNTMAIHFSDLTPEHAFFAGGKGGMLARLYQNGYPVPEGFVVLPSAFQDEKIKMGAWNEIREILDTIRMRNASARFAIRSSALSEDSEKASFAGEFETVLNMETDEEIEKAIHTVHGSGESERVKSYSVAHGIDQSHLVAVVVQLMVQSDISGVLFTADPITGSFTTMIGNYVHGLGEQLVSGEVNAFDFKLIRPKGKYEGPGEFKPFASKLYKLANKIKSELNSPQDIEWAVAGGKLYLLQSRPITTMSPGNIDTYDINYSLMGDELWTNTNVAEAIPDVYSPFSWSIARLIDEAMDFIPGYYVFSGNICGRPYMNISRRVSIIAAITGKDARGALKLLGDLYGELPEGMEIPVFPFSRLEALKTMLPTLLRFIKQSRKSSKNLNVYLEETPNWCADIQERIEMIKTEEELITLWRERLKPYLLDALQLASFSAIKIVNITALDKKLTALVGKEDANTLLSNLNRGAGLASLGPVLGIAKVMNGEMSRETYQTQYGHRGPHEYELSLPDPMEDPTWLAKQVDEHKMAGIDAEKLLKKQQEQYKSARRRFNERYPGKVKWLEKKMEKAAEAAQRREKGRSEFVRVFRMMRAFALKAGKLTGLEDDIFFLYINEVEKILSGIKPRVEVISIRKENHEKYKAMPRFPSIIRGRFNPMEWSKNPARRLDYYDATMPIEALSDSQTLYGCAGAAGRIEGTVRVLTTPEEGDQLQPGEILVAVTTNIGWTPLFPKAAAIVTDIGAPLSHAAIVARELGIPAVVGCTNATSRLKTGDRVLVDGGQGTVQILI